MSMSPTDQPRRPAGSPDGGQFRGDGAQESDVDLGASAQAAMMFGPRGEGVVRVVERASELTAAERLALDAAVPGDSATRAALIQARGLADRAARDAGLTFERGLLVDALDHVGAPQAARDAAAVELVGGKLSRADADMLLSAWQSLSPAQQPKAPRVQPPLNAQVDEYLEIVPPPNQRSDPDGFRTWVQDFVHDSAVLDHSDRQICAEMAELAREHDLDLDDAGQFLECEAELIEARLLKRAHGKGLI